MVGMEKRKDKNESLSTVIENREVEIKVHRTDERALLAFSSDSTDVSPLLSTFSIKW